MDAWCLPGPCCGRAAAAVSAGPCLHPFALIRQLRGSHYEAASRYFALFTKMLGVPRCGVKDLPQDLHRMPYVHESCIERGETEPEDITACHAAFDTRALCRLQH